MYVTVEEDALTEKVLNRVNSTTKTRSKLENLITSENLTKFNEAIKQFGFTEQDIMNAYGAMLVQEILDANELFKKYLLVVLDKTSLSLTGKEPLGSLLHKLEKNGIKHGFDECIDKELRNAIGHGWYWFENNIFYYVVDPDLKKTKNLTLGELFIKKIEVQLLTKCFIDNAFARVLELKKSSPDT